MAINEVTNNKIYNSSHRQNYYAVQRQKRGINASDGDSKMITVLFSNTVVL